MKNRIFIGEFIGSAFLVMVIVGSGIMAQNLTRDFAVMLLANTCLLYTSPSPRERQKSRMPSSA